MLRAPFIGSLLHRVRIKLDENLGGVACVDNRKTMYINPSLFAVFSNAEKITIIAHECLHLALRHVARAEAMRADITLYNIAADAVVNHILSLHNMQLPAGCITPQVIEEIIGGRVKAEEIGKMSAEAIYRLLEQQQDGKSQGEEGLRKFGRDLDTSRGRGGEDEEAEEEGSGEAGSEEDMDKYWREAVHNATVVAKTAGKIPAGLERLFGVLRPKINWRRLLKQSLVSGMGSKVVSTYSRPSRKHQLLPGLRRLTIHNVWCLIDTSGSISDEELNQFVSEVYGVARQFQASITVVPWDAQAYDIQRIKTPSDVKSIKIKGGGGTVISPVLHLVLKKMRSLDAVVILTDGVISDIDSKWVVEAMRRVASRASTCVFVTTSVSPSLPPKWRIISV